MRRDRQWGKPYSDGISSPPSPCCTRQPHCLCHPPRDRIPRAARLRSPASQGLPRLPHPRRAVTVTSVPACCPQPSATHPRLGRCRLGGSGGRLDRSVIARCTRVRSRRTKKRREARTAAAAHGDARRLDPLCNELPAARVRPHPPTPDRVRTSTTCFFRPLTKGSTRGPTCLYISTTHCGRRDEQLGEGEGGRKRTLTASLRTSSFTLPNAATMNAIAGCTHQISHHHTGQTGQTSSGTPCGATLNSVSSVISTCTARQHIPAILALAPSRVPAAGPAPHATRSAT
jgi:hypothetical protein